MNSNIEFEVLELLISDDERKSKDPFYYFFFKISGQAL